ncbi:serotonin receptor [Plakobranchus ocellatus]|uniref:Serotonin receptor n=1 Tax=Plakobranchus ocellatus TaxID=259542 RepID=A0AAV4DSD6_9GAST|nr:serotonin receptor [Plakobranchus ocellatus]
MASFQGNTSADFTTMAASNFATNSNSSTNFTLVASTTQEPVCMEEDPISSPELGYLTVAMGVILLGENLLLMIIIVRNHTLHTNTNILVASLAVTDILIGVQCCIMGLLNWPGGLRHWFRLGPSEFNVLDSMANSANFTFLIISMFHLTVLSVDRYFFVSWPFRYKRYVTRRRVIATAAGIWCTGIVYMLLPLVLFQTSQDEDNCTEFDIPHAYGEIPLTSVYFICLGVVFASTVGLARIACKHRRRRGRLLAQGRAPQNASDTGGNPADKHDKSKTSNKPTCTRQMKSDGDNIHTGQMTVTLEAIDTMLRKEVGNPANLNHSTPQNAKSVLKNHNERNNSFNNSHLLSSTNNFSHTLNGDTTKSQTGQINFANRAKKKISLSLPITTPVLTTESTFQETQKTHMDSACGTDSTACTTEANYPIAVASITGPISKLPEVDGQHSTPFQKNARPEVDSSTTKLFSKGNVKIIKFVLVMFGCFLVCTFPPLVTLMMEDIIASQTFSPTTIHALYFMLASNSAMNFLIISYMNKDFRAALIRSLPLCTFCCPTKYTANQSK